MYRGSFRSLRHPFADRSSGQVYGGLGAYSSRTASDQHHPANSRAIAALATLLGLLRFLNCIQRLLRRRLPRSPRALAAVEARSQQSRIVLPTT